MEERKEPEKKEDILKESNDKEDSILNSIENIFVEDEYGILIIKNENEKGELLNESSFELENSKEKKIIPKVEKGSDKGQFRFENLKPDEYVLKQIKDKKITEKWNVKVNKKGRVEVKNIRKNNKIEYKKEKIKVKGIFLN